MSMRAYFGEFNKVQSISKMCTQSYHAHKKTMAQFNQNLKHTNVPNESKRAYIWIVSSIRIEQIQSNFFVILLLPPKDQSD